MTAVHAHPAAAVSGTASRLGTRQEQLREAAMPARWGKDSMKAWDLELKLNSMVEMLPTMGERIMRQILPA